MSGFLTEDDFDKASSMLESSFPVEDDGDGFIGEPVDTEDQETLDDIKETSVASEDVEVDSGGEEEYAEGHRVPYNRFKSVVEARNEYKGEIETLRERNRELEAYLASKPSAPEGHESASTESEDYDYGLDFDDDTGVDGYDDGRVNQLEKQMHELRVQGYKQQLMRDMDTIKERYPNVPPESVLQAVANDPKTNVFQVAETFSTFLAEREEAAVQRYLKDNPQGAGRSPEAAPRPRSAGSGNSPRDSRAPKSNRPKHMKDVRNALLEHIRDNNIF